MKKNKKNKFSFRVFVVFIIFQVVFTMFTAPLIIYYGPFEDTRNIVVGSAMTTMNHKWIATLFLSKERIEEIQKKNKLEKIIQSDTKNINVNSNHDKSVEQYEVKGKNFKGTMLIINDPTRIKVGYSSKLGKIGETTSAMGKRYNALAAINGGAFTDRSPSGKRWAGNGGQPKGIIISNGNIVYNEFKDENEQKQIIGITKSGILLVGYHSLKEMREKNVMEAVSFDKPIIVDGRKTITHGDGGGGIAPRTAIGQKKDGSIILLVIDGRQPTSLGATYKDVQDLMYENGAYNAANLDGGSSSTLYYKGRVINNPCDILGERSIPTVFYVQQ